MFQHHRIRARLAMTTILLIASCVGCSASLEEGDATQLAMEEVRRTYPDPDQITCEVTAAARRADRGWTMEISVVPVEGEFEPNVHEVDVTPDGIVVDHSRNGQDVMSDEEEE